MVNDIDVAELDLTEHPEEHKHSRGHCNDLSSIVVLNKLHDKARNALTHQSNSDNR